jgi:hypothetical protein
VILRHSILLLAFLVLPTSAQAQQQNLRAGYVFPAGGQAGTKVIVTLGGQSLGGVSAVRVSGDGITAGSVEYVRPPNPGEAGTLRDEMFDLVQRRRDADRMASGGPSTRPWTDREESRLADIRKRLLAFASRASAPALQELVTVELSIAPNATPGPRELRIVTPAGLTPPLKFFVGRLPETTEGEPGKSDTRSDINVTLPATINGRIMPGDIDRIRFTGKRGQRIVAILHARELIPYISDAVPGWFQAQARILDSRGTELAFNDDFHNGPDPAVSLTLPADGSYTLEVRDTLFRGREDFIYRLSLGELPLLVSSFPLGGPVGSPTPVELRGVNLPPAATTRPLPSQPGFASLSWHIRGMLVGPLHFDADNLPESLDQSLAPRKPTSRPLDQPVSPPLIINGRISSPGERDTYSFDAAAGDQIAVEVTARRAGSPLDSVVRILDEHDNVVALNDDNLDRGSGLTTHHADSCLLATLPAAGRYRAEISDIQGHGGPDYAYRLRISPPRPDVELRYAPSALLLRPGSPSVVSVYAIRRDGYSGPIDLALANPLPGISLSGQRIPPNTDSIRMTLTATSDSPEGTFPLHLLGSLTTSAETLSRPVVPADDWQQAFSYRHLVIADEGLLVITRRPGNRTAPSILSPGPARLSPGQTTTVRIALPQLANARGRDAADFLFTLSDPPPGVEIQSARIDGSTVELTLAAANSAKPPLAGNLIVEIATLRQRRVPLGFLPAIPFQLVNPAPSTAADAAGK